MDEVRGEVIRGAMKVVSLLLVFLGLAMVACDRHQWESVDRDGDGKISSTERGTKELYEHHGHHEEHHGDGHGKGHGDKHGNDHDGEHAEGHENGHGVKAEGEHEGEEHGKSEEEH